MPRIRCLLASFLLVVACGTDNLSSKSVARSEAADAAAASTEDGATRSGAGLVETETGWRLTTDSYQVNPGEERYVCYVVSVPKDIVIGAIRSPDNPMIHHFLLVEPMVPEAEGSRECDVILELTWAPLYAATHANSALVMPPGAARTVKQGAQLLLQVHLSNV